MTATLALTPAELAEVKAILASHLPVGVRAYVFGSRATGKAKPWSDLDLVLDGPQALSLSVMARLAEAFDESALPWKVDLIDRRTVSAAFGTIIDAVSVDLP